LIVTDLNMPRLDGLGLVRALRESHRRKGCPAVPAILVTGSSPDHMRPAADAMGILAVLPKPVETHALRALVARVLPRAGLLEIGNPHGGGMRSRPSSLGT
jgi:two-component system, chemotaxis family, chemotaxis protein CheY